MKTIISWKFQDVSADQKSNFGKQNSRIKNKSKDYQLERQPLQKKLAVVHVFMEA